MYKDVYPPLQGYAEYSHCPKNLLCSTFLSLPPLPTLSNHWSFYFLHSFAFSKPSYSWNSILEQDSQPPHLFPIVAQARERGPWAHQPPCCPAPGPAQTSPCFKEAGGASGCLFQNPTLLPGNQAFFQLSEWVTGKGTIRSSNFCFLTSILIQSILYTDILMYIDISLYGRFC